MPSKIKKLADIAEDYIFALEHDLEDLKERAKFPGSLDWCPLDDDIKFIKNKIRRIKTVLRG